MPVYAAVLAPAAGTRAACPGWGPCPENPTVKPSGTLCERPPPPPDRQLALREPAHLGLHLQDALHAALVVVLHVAVELEAPRHVCAAQTRVSPGLLLGYGAETKAHRGADTVCIRTSSTLSASGHRAHQPCVGVSEVLPTNQVRTARRNLTTWSRCRPAPSS